MSSNDAQEQPDQAPLHICVIQLWGGFHSQAFPGVLIDHVQDAERPSIMGSLHDKIVAPDMARNLGL